MKARRPSAVVTLMLAAALLLGSVPASALDVPTATAAETVAARGPILGAVSFQGTSLTGMTENEARSFLTSAAVVPALDKTVVRAAGKRFYFYTRRAVSVNVSAMLDKAYAVPPAVSEPVTGSVEPTGTTEPTGSVDTTVPAPVELRMAYTVRDWVVKAWAAKVAGSVDRTKRNAYRKVVDERLVVVPEVIGRKVKPVATGETITARIKYELANPARQPGSVAARVAYYTPAVTLSNIGKAILVDLSKRRIYLYKLRHTEKSYACAIGMPGYETPRGKFSVTGKVKWPTWRNPGSAWAANMPAYIGPGPSNPLGTRAIYLSAPGIRIHGTSQWWSIGRAASHGCLRMRRADVEDLYPRVPVGISVWIIR